MGNFIFGPAMIPDKKIYRNSNKVIGEPHYVLFTAETISQLKTKFHKNNFDNKVNIEHDGIQVEGVSMTKSFLIDQENRKSLPNEYQDLPDGTWMIEYEIKNNVVWEEIKDKKLNGFSVEGLFEYGDKWDE